MCQTQVINFTMRHWRDFCGKIYQLNLRSKTHVATITKRMTDSGIVSYQVRVRLKGSHQQTATFARLTDAKRWVSSIESAIRENRYFKTAEAKRRTLAEAIARYERTHLTTLKSANDRHLHLGWWKEQLGALSLVAINPAVITESRDKLTVDKQRSPATVNRYLAALSHVLTLAAREWHWIDRNPCEQISNLKEPRGRVRFLDDAERARLLAECKVSAQTKLCTLSLCWRLVQAPVRERL